MKLLLVAVVALAIVSLLSMVWLIAAAIRSGEGRRLPPLEIADPYRRPRRQFRRRLRRAGIR